MPLVRLIYVSQAKDAEKIDINSLLEKARANNASKGVTGMLWFNGFYFLQLLEGERKNVNEIYHLIVQDPRHENFQLIAFEEIPYKNFADWSMGYFADMIKNISNINAFNLPEEFEPDVLSPASAFAMLQFALEKEKQD